MALKISDLTDEELDALIEQSSAPASVTSGDIFGTPTLTDVVGKTSLTPAEQEAVNAVIAEAAATGTNIFEAPTTATVNTPAVTTTAPATIFDAQQVTSGVKAIEGAGSLSDVLRQDPGLIQSTPDGQKDAGSRTGVTRTGTLGGNINEVGIIGGTVFDPGEASAALGRLTRRPPDAMPEDTPFGRIYNEEVARRNQIAIDKGSRQLRLLTSKRLVRLPIGRLSNRTLNWLTPPATNNGPLGHRLLPAFRKAAYRLFSRYRLILRPD